ncbi:hypothetical protein CNEO_20050 [Clostridium neonatale]|uniref:N-acetyltransferase domain-containing protein n=2 Tax=Clostridium neonatale TaxID=137838 RepID=A0AA86JD17_9CLOT|nr:hypothetical protein CNEO_20050 [Clostridium neonatale]
MCASFGFKVVKLKRVRIMNIKLSDLKEGSLREITNDEIIYLKSIYDICTEEEIAFMERLQDKIEYVFIDNKSHLYEQSIDLRYDEFYKNFNRTRESIFDEFEDKSIRIVACIDNKVIGNARLFIDEEKNAEITQVVVHKEYRGMNIGAEIMKKLLLYAKDNNVRKQNLMQDICC